MRVKTRFKRPSRLVGLCVPLVFAFVFALLHLATNSGAGDTNRGGNQVSVRENALSVGRFCHSSIQNTYAYRMNAPEKGEKQPRPGHWFHFIEFHLPLSFTERSNPFDLDVGSFNLLLLLPKISWISELTPMTRFFLSAAYSAPFVRRDVAALVFPQSITFLSAENSLRSTHGMKSPEIDGDRASIVAKRSHIWTSTIHQSIFDRFVRSDALICRNADGMVEFDTELLSTNVAKSGTGFGRVNSPVHEWFATIEEAQAMRQSFDMLCRIVSADESNSVELHARVPRKLDEAKTGCLSELMSTANEDDKKKRQAVIYQRDFNRKFSDVNQVKSEIKRALGPDWSVSVVMHDDDNPPCLLYHCLKRVELLITPHGFQSMLTMFLPTRAYMFEIFPSRYRWTGYKALGLMFGVRHVWVESHPLTMFGRALSAAFTTKRCMASYFCRYLVRKSDVSFDELSSSTLEKIVERT